MLVNEYSDKIKRNKPRNRHDERRSKLDLSDADQSFTILDIGCGKGGDLLKWSKANIDHFVGVDIAATSVEQAKSRYQDMRNRNHRGGKGFSADFHAADCTKVDLETLYNHEQKGGSIS